MWRQNIIILLGSDCQINMHTRIYTINRYIPTFTLQFDFNCNSSWVILRHFSDKPILNTVHWSLLWHLLNDLPAHSKFRDIVLHGLMCHQHCLLRCSGLLWLSETQKELRLSISLRFNVTHSLRLFLFPFNKSGHSFYFALLPFQCASLSLVNLKKSIFPSDSREL